MIQSHRAARPFLRRALLPAVLAAIVMGAGTSGLADRMLGSVTLDLVQDAPVPVTVVHPNRQA